MKAHLKYLNYVLRHKWFVYLWCRRVGNVSLWQAVIHDWTKFLPCEWGPYVKTFYGPKIEPSYGDSRNHGGLSPDECEALKQKRKDAFDHAWNHHQKANKHHWQYWVILTDSDKPRLRSIAMPIKYAAEMVADWCGAGQAINGKMEVWTWYEKNRDNIALHEDTRRWVESCITFLKAMADERSRMDERARRLGIPV